MSYAPTDRPTLWFIGVTTGQSSINRVFPSWAEALGLDAVLRGMDFEPHAAPAAYRKAVEFIKSDPNSCGALVTTHKIDLFKACRDQFDEIDRYAALMGETSCLSKRGNSLVSHAKDPISSGLALDGLLPSEHFTRTGAEMFVMGAGGSAIAMTWHLMKEERGKDRPTRIVVSDTRTDRLAHIRCIHERLGSDIDVEYRAIDRTEGNDALVGDLVPGSIVVNATGLGKDRPGSPVSDAARFPEAGFVWELNYRGERHFLIQAKRQKARKNLHIFDGWTYFLHGWAQVIGEVFDIEMPTEGAAFDRLGTIAAKATERS